MNFLFALLFPLATIAFSGVMVIDYLVCRRRWSFYPTAALSVQIIVVISMSRAVNTIAAPSRQFWICHSIRKLRYTTVYINSK